MFSLLVNYKCTGLVLSNSHVRISSQVVDLVIGILFFLFPESEVFLEELDNALGISEVVLFELVNLVESFLESLVSEVAGGLVVLHHFVVEDGEVERQTELDWVAWREGNFVGFVVSLESLLLHFLELRVLGVFSDVTVVVTDHFHEECLGLTVAVFGKDLLLNHENDLLAVCSELGLNSFLVLSECVGELGVLRVLLDGGNGAA